MVAIFTKFIPPSNTKGARIKAYTDNHSVTISYNYDKGHDDRHREAVVQLCKKLDWHGVLVEGGHEHGNVYVFLDVRGICQPVPALNCFNV